MAGTCRDSALPLLPALPHHHHNHTTETMSISKTASSVIPSNPHLLTNRNHNFTSSSASHLNSNNNKPHSHLYYPISQHLINYIKSLQHYSPHIRDLFTWAREEIFDKWEREILEEMRMASRLQQQQQEDDTGIDAAAERQEAITAERHLLRHQDQLFRAELRKYYQRKREYNLEKQYHNAQLRHRLLGQHASSREADSSDVASSHGTKKRASSRLSLSTKQSTSSSRLKSKQQSKITSNLQKTKSLLSQELDKSDANMMVVGEMSHLLKQTLKQQQEYQNSVSQSSKKISSLKKRSQWDYYINRGAFFFFILVCLYVFNKRLRILTLIFRIVWGFCKLLMFWRWFEYLGWSNGNDVSPSQANIEL